MDALGPKGTRHIEQLAHIPKGAALARPMCTTGLGPHVPNRRENKKSAGLY